MLWTDNVDLLFLAYGFKVCQVPGTCPLLSPFGVYKPLFIPIDQYQNIAILYILNQMKSKHRDVRVGVIRYLYKSF